MQNPLEKVFDSNISLLKTAEDEVANCSATHDGCFPLHPGGDSKLQRARIMFYLFNKLSNKIRRYMSWILILIEENVCEDINVANS